MHTPKEMLLSFYASMYAWCMEKARQEPQLKEYYWQRSAFYEKIFLQIAPPININQLISA